MPFYKWIILKPDISSKRNNPGIGNTSNVNFDGDLIVNQRMVNVIRHISQLARIADDVFSAIEIECKHILERTSDLFTRIQTCQGIVDKPDAKAVKVPVSSITGNQKTLCDTYRSCDDKDLDQPPIFCTFPRSPEVERLRNLANGPSPPALIPSDKVIETGGDPGTSSGSDTTHIFCMPLQIKEPKRLKSNVSAENRNKKDKNMSSSVTVPSNVVSIDVNGHSFSRMSSLRRSLIHVEFFIRRKKKDKRRNTVAEGNTKELKNVLQNIINEDHHQGIPDGTLSNKCITNGAPKTQLQSNKKITAEETNNNITKGTASSENGHLKTSIETNQDKRKISQNGHLKENSKTALNCDAVNGNITKKKLKGHIPISTISAAMNVAVKMRDGNNSEERSSSSNWSYSSDQNSSDSDIRISSKNSEGNDHTVTVGEDSGFSDSLKNENCKNALNPQALKDYDEREGTISASSENTMPENESSNATSLASGSYAFYSDGSDEELIDILENRLTFENRGSRNSINTVGNGSLNSLLSQTGAEIASSTGTLTSIGLEQFPTPPPPMSPDSLEEDNGEDIPDSTIFLPEFENKDITQNSQVNTDASSISKKEATFEIESVKKEVIIDSTPMLVKFDKNLINASSKQMTSSKKNKRCANPKNLLKSDNLTQRKNKEDNKKGIFSSLVRKSRCKNQFIDKDVAIKTSSKVIKPSFDMYGDNSPIGESHLPSFIQQNNHCLTPKTKHKSSLQSFSPDGNMISLVNIQNRSGLSDQRLQKVDTIPLGYHLSRFDKSYGFASTIKPTEMPFKEAQKLLMNSEISKNSKTGSPIQYVKGNEENNKTPLIRKPEIPQKYMQQIIVTPKSRDTSSDSNNHFSQIPQYNSNTGARPKIISNATVKSQSHPTRNHVNENQIKTQGARVTLKEDGTVILRNESQDFHQTYKSHVHPQPYGSLVQQQTNEFSESNQQNEYLDHYQNRGSLDRYQLQRSHGHFHNRRSHDRHQIQGSLDHPQPHTSLNFHQSRSSCNQISTEYNEDRRSSFAYPLSLPLRNYEYAHRNSLPRNFSYQSLPDCIQPENFTHQNLNENVLSTFRHSSVNKDVSGNQQYGINTSQENQFQNDSIKNCYPKNKNELQENCFHSHLSSIIRKSRLPTYDEAIGFKQSINMGDPNKSGLPEVKSQLTEENLHRHLANMERIQSREFDEVLTSPKISITSPLNTSLSKLQKAKVSTEDLFAVIHDCKKRMNIKTDCTRSLGSSSRSNSPSRNRVKGTLAETGYLSPRNSLSGNSLERRSVSDFRCFSSPNERKSLASDRLGRKQTSMREFKMLLLQTRTNNQTSEPRRSAAEMLGIPLSPNGQILSPSADSSPTSGSAILRPTYTTEDFAEECSPVPSCAPMPDGEATSSRPFASLRDSSFKIARPIAKVLPQYHQSLSHPNSQTSALSSHSGHSTVPFRRHNNRYRGSLQLRYTLYPPIIEDTLEEVENNRDNFSEQFNDNDC